MDLSATTAISSLAGGIAGLCVDFTLFPLDTLKTRLQSSNGFRAAGGFRGVYNGLASALIGSVPSAALFWCTYDLGKHFFETKDPKTNKKTAPKYAVYMTCASMGEIAACIVRVPVENVKQKMQAGLYKTTSATVKALRTSMPFMGGFYVGFMSTIMREIPFAVIQFPLYESAKIRWSKYSGLPDVHHLETWKASICGSMAGGVAAALTTPMDVIKTRLMLGADRNGKRYVGMGDAIRRIWIEEGPKTFFSGVVPRVIWISMGGAVFFGAYDAAKKILTKSYTIVAPVVVDGKHSSSSTKKNLS